MGVTTAAEEVGVISQASGATTGRAEGMKRYIKGATLGEGSFGVVTKAEDTLTQKHVAIKKIRLGKYKEGVNFTAIREIKLLQELKHPHIIELVDVFPHKRNLNLVFECCESDLEAVIKDKFLPLGVPEIKSYMSMTLTAVAYCHFAWVLHRDLKPNNLLIAPNGALKLADFGLARVFGSPNRKFTHQVFARWYRAPELLLGSKVYGPGVDMWAVGCIFAELMLRKPFFPGSSDIDQLGRIYAGLGTPTEESWPGHKNLPDYVEFSHCPCPPLRQLFVTAPPDALDLLQKLMAFDPNRRLSAEDALKHPYFSTQPLATPFPNLPRPTQRFGDEEGGGGGGGGGGPGPGGGPGERRGVWDADDAGGGGGGRGEGRDNRGRGGIGGGAGGGSVSGRGDESDLMPPPGARGGGSVPSSESPAEMGMNNHRNGGVGGGVGGGGVGGGGGRRSYPPGYGSGAAMDTSGGGGVFTETKRGRYGDHTAPMSTGGGGTGGDIGDTGGRRGGGGGGHHRGFGGGDAGSSGSEFKGLDSCDRPALNTVDRAYLRKRKLELDNAFLAASQDFSEEQEGGGFSQGLDSDSQQQHQQHE